MDSQQNTSAEAAKSAGLDALKAGRFTEAQAHFNQALDLSAEEPETLHFLGVACLRLGQLEAGATHIKRALTLKPDFPAALNNLANALQMQNKLDAAVDIYRQALSLKPSASAHHNLARAFLGLRDADQARTHFEHALQLDPQSAGSHCGLGAALRMKYLMPEALASFLKAVDLNPGLADAYYGAGNALQDMRRYDEALKSYDYALNLRDDHADALAQYVQCAMRMCAWEDFSSYSRILVNRSQDATFDGAVFPLLNIIDDPAVHMTAARFTARNSFPPVHAPPAQPAMADKIRVAYISGDFHDHPVPFLAASLFESHDRTKFEVHALSYGPDSQGPMRNRLRTAFDHFHDVQGLTDSQTAGKIRTLGIHVAVDLKGMTPHARPNILAGRPAPCQVSYLGYPGTSGLDFIDYLVADDIVAPASQQSFYTEKLVNLPGTYQVNGDDREILPLFQTRSSVGLPEQGFVFCCFNSSNKITPDIFTIWMRLLKQTPGSVLWLLEDNTWARDNLRREAQAREVSSERLVFAPRTFPAQHLARQKLADLFLDTFPYTAHTTASDALWAGLPILTCPGRSFASKVAASLLRTVSLEELIVPDHAAYESLALDLSVNSAKLSAIRNTLAAARTQSPLFDAQAFCRRLESAYTTMVEKWRSGEQPTPFHVAKP